MRIEYCLFALLFIIPMARSSESNKYDFKWLDPDKEVYVLQNRQFRKKNRLNLSLHGGITTSGAFANANLLQGRLSFFFSEEMGIEVVYSQVDSEQNDTATAVVNSGSIPFIRKGVNYYGAMFVWSPFYSKINTFNKIFYYDWIFGLGAGKYTDENNQNDITSNTNGQSYVQEDNSSILWNIGIKLFMTKSLSMRIDFLGNHYKALQYGRTGPIEERYFEHYDLTLGLSYAF